MTRCESEAACEVCCDTRVEHFVDEDGFIEIQDCTACVLGGPNDPLPRLAADAIKVAICEALLAINKEMDGPFIPPTAIDWIGNRLTKAVLDTEESRPE